MKPKREFMGTFLPSSFLVRFAEIGTDTMRATYKKTEHENALVLGAWTVKAMGDNFFHGDNTKAMFEYSLACFLLHRLEIVPEQLLKDIAASHDKEWVGAWDATKVFRVKA